MDKKEGEHDYFFNMNGTPLGERTVGAEAAAVSNGLGGASESNSSLGSGLRSTGGSFLCRCVS